MSQLTKNTTDLDALIAKANALPDAVDTSDADATASDIVSPKTAYVNGVKLTGINPYEKNATDTHIANALTEIANKGVTVPSGADVSDLATLISAIESGDTSVGFHKIASGSFTLTSDTPISSYTITHNGGKVPKYFYVSVQGSTSISNGIYAAYMHFYDNGIINYDYHHRTSSGGVSYAGGAEPSNKGYVTTSVVKFTSSTYKLQGKVQYAWAAYE